MDLWNDPWGRKWVPYEGGVFELAPDDGIASWQSRAKAPEEGIPIPPLVAARVEEVVRGGNLPAPAYPPWIDGSGEIVDPKEWGGKMGVVAGEGSGNVGEIEHSGGALLRAGRGGETPSDGIEGTTFFWGGVARIDVLQVKLDAFVFPLRNPFVFNRSSPLERQLLSAKCPFSWLHDGKQSSLVKPL